VVGEKQLLIFFSGPTFQTQGGSPDACCPPSSFPIRCPTVSDPKPLAMPRGIQLHGPARGAFPHLALPNAFSFAFTLCPLRDIPETNPFPAQLGRGSKPCPRRPHKHKAPADPPCRSRGKSEPLGICGVTKTTPRPQK